VSETPQSHRGQPVVCLVYAVAVHSQSSHHIMLWPCFESIRCAAVSRHDRGPTFHQKCILIQYWHTHTGMRGQAVRGRAIKNSYPFFIASGVVPLHKQCPHGVSICCAVQLLLLIVALVL